MPRSPTFQFTAYLLHVLTWARDLPAFPAPEGSSCGGLGPGAALGGLGAESPSGWSSLRAFGHAASPDALPDRPLQHCSLRNHASNVLLCISLLTHCCLSPSQSTKVLPEHSCCLSRSLASSRPGWHPDQDGPQTRMTPRPAARCRLLSRVSGGNGPSCSTSHPILTDTGLLPKAGS